LVGELRVTLREAPPLAVIDLWGAVTGSAEDSINTVYQTVCAQGARDILLNFSGVNHLDSSGISVVIGVLAEARKRDQRLLVVGLTQHYRKIFDVMGLSRFAPVFETEDAAQRWAGSR
jgi:anti-anti-sigma factor